jgi:KDO2-lipid IV(A) lauroyltransferase
MRDLPLIPGADTTGLRDVRSGGAWTPAQRTKNDAIWALSTLGLMGLGRLPLAALRLLGRGLGLAAYALVASARRTAEANVERAMPELDARERRRLVRRCFVTLGGLLGETVAALRPGGGAPLLELSEEARATLAEARSEGRGVVFPSAHLGPWERVAASLVAGGIPLVTLARESYDPRFSDLYTRLRGGHGVGVVWRSSPGAASRILRTLRAGQVLGVPMDLRSRVPSCSVPFLGHPAPTPIGPARIALRAGSPVVVGTAAPRPAGAATKSQPWWVTATRIPTDDLACCDEAEAAIELTARINRALSHRILAMPQAWVWMHDRWPGIGPTRNRVIIRPEERHPERGPGFDSAAG